MNINSGIKLDSCSNPRMLSVLDSSIAAYNIGNRIIMDAVSLHLSEMFPSDFIIPLPMEDIKKNSRRYIELSEMTFVGGTNVLNCDIRKYRQWDLDLHNILRLKRLVLMGVGWWKYEDRPISKYTKWALSQILSKDYVHSVRDSYTQQRLAQIGIKSINTGCPTLWNITPAKVATLNTKKKQKNVIITITDYDRNIERDRAMIDICSKCYDKIYWFVQGVGDFDYLKSVGTGIKMDIIYPQISKYNDVLKFGDCDYVGTRLHAGIRALQMGVRSYIIAIDNRSVEMGRDFGLPVIAADKIQSLGDIVNSNYNLLMNIPYDRINEWKSQFIRK